MDISEEARNLHFILGPKLAAFGLAVDCMDMDLLATVFADDVVGDYSGVVRHRSRRQFVAQLQEHLGPGSNCGRRQHNVMNLVVLKSGQDNAVTRCNFYAVHQGENRFAGQLWKTWGEYHDSWSRAGADWLITHRRYTTYFTEGPDEINTRSPAA